MKGLYASAFAVAAVFVSGCSEIPSDFGDSDSASTPAPTTTPTPDATQVPTASPTPTAAPATTPTPAPTAGPAPTAAPTPTPSTTAAPTPTPVVTVAPTATPTLTPTPTPTSTPDTAGNCFNPTLLATGTTIDWSYRSTNSSGENTFRDQRTVIGPMTFNGQNAIETDGRTDTTTNGTTATVQTLTYSTLDTANQSISSLGTITTSAEGGVNVTATNTIDPPRVDRYNLSTGESDTRSYTITTETNTSGFTFTSTNMVNDTRTFVGYETVTVPAGTFTACRFTEAGTRTVNAAGTTTTENFSTTQWFSINDGVLIRQEADDTTSVLLEAFINGSPVN